MAERVVRPTFHKHPSSFPTVAEAVTIVGAASAGALGGACAGAVYGSMITVLFGAMGGAVAGMIGALKYLGIEG